MGWHLAACRVVSHLGVCTLFLLSRSSSLSRLSPLAWPGLICPLAMVPRAPPHSGALWLPGATQHPVHLHSLWPRWAHHQYFFFQRYTEEMGLCSSGSQDLPTSGGRFGDGVAE